MKTHVLAALLLAPGLALAAECQHSAPRALDLDLEGVSSIRFAVAGHTLQIEPGSGQPSVSGKACSSDPEMLGAITVEQSRSGSELRVELKSEARFSGIFFGRTYAYLDLAASLPADMPISLELGSGELEVRGMRTVEAQVGSGDLDLRDGSSLRLTVGSGDAEIANLDGTVEVEVGSGDVSIENVAGLRVFQVGSGDLEATDVRGDVHIERLGSGDIELTGIRGNVVVDRIGSGDLEVRDVTGGLRVVEIGAGDVDHRGVAGAVELPGRR